MSQCEQTTETFRSVDHAIQTAPVPPKPGWWKTRVQVEREGFVKEPDGFGDNSAEQDDMEEDE